MMRRLIKRIARSDERLWRLAVRIANVTCALRDLLPVPGDLTRLWAVLSRVDRERGRPAVPARRGGAPGVCMLVVSDLYRDPRVERSARVLAGAGIPVTVLCPRLSHEDVREPPDWGPGVGFRMMPFRRSFFRFPYLYDPVMEREAERLDCAVIYCNDLNTALVGLSVARSRQRLCVCDFHEWWSENAKFDVASGTFVPLPTHVRLLSKQVERVVMRRADAVITVSQAIVDALMREYRPSRPVHLIRNIPAVTRARAGRYDLRAELGIPPDRFLVLYQGGVGPSRHLEPIVEAVARLEGVVLAIRGPGVEVFGEQYAARGAALGAADRVRCLPPIPSADVVAACHGADAGIWTLAPICLNFELALPNKVFEYLAAGLPLLVAHHPEPRRIVDEFRCGECFDPDDPADIARAIARLRDDRGLRGEMSANARRAARAFDPDAEARKVCEVYRELLEEPDQA